MNAVEIEQALSDLAAQTFDAAEFPFAFMAAFGNKETTLKLLRTGSNNASNVPGGVLRRNTIRIAACAPTIDGHTLEAEDLIAGETLACDFPGGSPAKTAARKAAA